MLDLLVKKTHDQGGILKVKFTLTIDDLTVDDEHYDQVIIDWVGDHSQDEVLEMSQNWITSTNFLTRRMIGLERVGEASLTIEPLGDELVANPTEEFV